MKRFCRHVFFAIACLGLAASATAAPPQTISYQGYLTNAGGTPVNSGVVMTFRIYNAASGGTLLYTETQLSVAVSNGGFNAQIGAVTPLTLPFDVPYWLTAAINADPEMTPRQPLASTPYAFRAAAADSVSSAASIPGAQVTGAVLQGGNTPGATMTVGTTDNNVFIILANNEAAFRVFPTATSPNLIGGSGANFINADVAAAVVSGGGLNGTTDPTTNIGCGTSCANRVTDHAGTVGGGVGNQAGNSNATMADAAYATVGGGFSNTASGIRSTVGGGGLNTASGNTGTVGGGLSNMATGVASTVGGGSINTASGNYSSVGGGNSNTASGPNSTAGGGESNTASGTSSFAAGTRAKTQTAGGSPTVHDGAFVWADSNALDFNSTAANEFSARATGGFRFVTAINGTGIPTAQVSIDNTATATLGGLKVASNGSKFTRMQAGETSVGSGVGGVNVYTVTFPAAFTSAPKVVVSPKVDLLGAVEVNDTFVASIRAISTTQFKVNVYRVDIAGAAWTANLRLEWIAWE